MTVSAPAERIGRQYVLGKLLGVGGMGRVYAAEASNGSHLAIKLLHATHASDPGMIARFTDEARAGMRVSHPNVVRVLDQGVSDDGRLYLVMDRVRGTSLSAIIQREGPLPLSRIRAILSQILAGLAAIHRAGLVHGDLKSDNVLVDSPDGVDRITIIDLGLARSPGMHAACDDGQMVSGTPEYMAPELIRGEPITMATDLYAVGVIAYELVTGSTPFCGGTSEMIFERQLADEVVPPSLRCPDRMIPPTFEGVILRALDKDPDARHLNAELFATAVERSLTASLDDLPCIRPPFRFSTERPTRDWSRPSSRRDGNSRRRFARCTHAPEVEPLLAHPREELRRALAKGTPEPVVLAYLGLAEALIEGRRLREAARELETAVAWSQRLDAPPASVWRLVLTLAAVYEGMGERARARRTALDAFARAGAASCEVGQARSKALLHRLDGERERKRMVTHVRMA